MLNYHQLQKTIKLFFENLIITRNHDAVLTMIVAIANQLWFAPQFSSLYWNWMKQLLDRGDKKTKESTYEELIRLAKKNELIIYDLLANIAKWIPESDRDRDKYSASNIYALMFLFSYCNQYKTSLEEDNYPLFDSFQDDFDLAEKRYKFLISLVFHKGVKCVIDDAVKESADLIEDWFAILCKRDCLLLKSNVMSDSLVKETVLFLINIYDRRKLKRCWKIKEK